MQIYEELIELNEELDKFNDKLKQKEKNFRRRACCTRSRDH